MWIIILDTNDLRKHMLQRTVKVNPYVSKFQLSLVSSDSEFCTIKKVDNEWDAYKIQVPDGIRAYLCWSVSHTVMI